MLPTDLLFKADTLDQKSSDFSPLVVTDKQTFNI